MNLDLRVLSSLIPEVFVKSLFDIRALDVLDGADALPVGVVLGELHEEAIDEVVGGADVVDR